MFLKFHPQKDLDQINLKKWMNEQFKKIIDIAAIYVDIDCFVIIACTMEQMSQHFRSLN